MQIVEVSVGKLNPSAYNPRVISDEDMDNLKRVMEEFGCVEPLVVNKDFSVIGGHQRLVAAKDLGWKKVPVFMVDLSEEKAKILNLALNRIHGDWDYPMLRDMLVDLDTGAFDIELTGFGPSEIEDLFTLYGDEYKRPDFDELVDEFDAGNVGKSEKDKNWFYVEYYGNDRKFKHLSKLLEPILKTKHEIDPKEFEAMVELWNESQESS